MARTTDPTSKSSTILSGSAYHMQPLDPFTKKPWTPAEQKVIDQLNTYGDQFAQAVASGDDTKAKQILSDRDNLLDGTTDEEIQKAFFVASLNAMVGGLVDTYGDTD